jgi:RHS repeat-associated protein
MGYLLRDGLDSTTELADGAGNLTGTYRYDVFGAPRSQTGATTESNFTGEQTDPTALQYLRARYYDPAVGRFISRDPLGSGYPYVSNNPVNLVDPTGLSPLSPCQMSREDAPTPCPPLNPYFVSVPMGYIDANFAACFFVCVTAGVQWSLSSGFHFYVGGGVGSPQISGSITAGPGQDISQGWSCGVQVSAGEGKTITVQIGLGGMDPLEADWGAIFGELGTSAGFSLTPVAASATCYYVF